MEGEEPAPPEVKTPIAISRDCLLRVVTAAPHPRAGGASVPLGEVLKHPGWAEAVAASPLKDHFLTAMTYDELVSIERARVLSYRADNIVDVHCDAVDPAGEIDHVSGAAPFSVLNTPADGWSHLWIDALDGIFDESQRPKTLGITPHLLLHVTVLPQYWLNGDFAAANQAMSRAWIHQELAYGRLDHGALHKLFQICLAKHKEQTAGKIWKGTRAELEGPRLLSRVVGKRCRAAMSDADDMVESAWSAIEWFARANKDTGIAVEATGEETDDECVMLLGDYVKALGARQLSETVERNVDALTNNAALAFSVVKSYGNTKMFDPAEMYVSSLGVVAAACGMPDVADPLGEYRASFLSKGGKTPKNADGSLRYTVEDVDLDVLNANHACLRLAWRNLLTKMDASGVPAAIVGVGPTDRCKLDWTRCPPGVATLGMGPIPADAIVDGKLKLGHFYGFDMTTEGPTPSDGYWCQGDMRGVVDVSGEAQFVDGPASPTPEELEARFGGPRASSGRRASISRVIFAPNEFTRESFGVAYCGFNPRCVWNVSLADVEAEEKESAEFERTLRNLWNAWLTEYDTDGSGTISLDELKAFASLPECPSGDGYMRSLYEWAAGNFASGDLEGAFNEVDADGSGEMEFEEFKLMLSA